MQFLVVFCSRGSLKKSYLIMDIFLWILYSGLWILIPDFDLFSFIIFDWPPWPNSVLIVGCWCSNPRIEATGTPYSFTIWYLNAM